MDAPVIVTQPVWTWTFPDGCENDVVRLTITMPVLDREPDHIPYQVGTLEPIFTTDPTLLSNLPGYPDRDTQSTNRPIYGRGGNWGNLFVDGDWRYGRWAIYLDGVRTIEVLHDDGDPDPFTVDITLPPGETWLDDHEVWLAVEAWEDVPPWHYWDYTLHPIGVSAYTEVEGNTLDWHNPDVHDRGTKFTDSYTVTDRRGNVSPLDWGPFGPDNVPPKWLLSVDELFINPVGLLLFPEYVDQVFWPVETDHITPHCPNAMHVNQRV